MTKKRRDSGLEYITKSKNLRQKRVLKAVCRDTCKLKCREKINEEMRQKILETFWTDNKSIDTKRQYLASHIQQVPIKTRRERTNARQGKRQHTNKYFFEKNGQHVTVCKKFFLGTLSISQQMIDTAVIKKKRWRFRITR